MGRAPAAPVPAAVTPQRATTSWRRPLPGATGWIAASLIVALLALAPILSLALIATRGSGDLWPHLARFVLPQAAVTTAVLLAGVAVIVTVLGVATAWLVTAYAFPGSRVLDWALLLPLAVPTYVVAFAYVDILHPLGPVQGALRALLGIADPRGLRLPDVRSLGGAILLLGFVLYPYVYLATRAMFLMQAASLIEAARLLGSGRRGVFQRVALPLARPAIAAGVSLALMETLNDIGAAEFLGVNTLTLSIYATWINRSSLPGAAQIALLMLAIVALLVFVERTARRRQTYAAAARHGRRMAPQPLTGALGLVAFALAAAPVAIGFLVPLAHLVAVTLRRLDLAGLSPSIAAAILNTVTVAGIAAAITVGLGFLIAGAMRLAAGPAAPGRHVMPAVAAAASLGYAVPGTVLAVGLLAPLAVIDNALGGLLKAAFGTAPGLILLGSGVGIVYAYGVRFLAIATGSIDAGLARIPRTLDDAARMCGAGTFTIARRVHLGLLKPAIAAAALLIFVDGMKELPATLLLRPLNFETLATLLYAEAARGVYEDGAVAALLIVLFGLAPVMVLAKLSRAPQSAEAGAARRLAAATP